MLVVGLSAVAAQVVVWSTSMNMELFCASKGVAVECLNWIYRVVDGTMAGLIYSSIIISIWLDINNIVVKFSSAYSITTIPFHVDAVPMA